MTDKEKAFLIGLGKLTRETGIEIYGCGCCGSPALCDADITSDASGYSHYGEVKWIDPSNKRDWKEFSDSIVK